MQFRTSVSLALVVALTALTGCATASETPIASPTVTSDPTIPLAELDILADPHSYVGESTAVLATEAIEAGPVPDQKLPATITSHDLDGDTDVTIESTDRVIAMDLAGSIASTVVALEIGRAHV